MKKIRIFKIAYLSFGFIFRGYYRNVWGLRNVISNKTGVMKQFFIFIYEREMQKLNSWIGYDAKILEIPFFPHGISGIYISRDAIIGKKCTIFQQVTIGSNTLSGSNIGSPIIGDNVYIGAGAKLIGGIKIGNDCRIGANCVVYKDMPNNAVAVCAETRIILKENSLDNRFFTLRENDDGEKRWYYYEDEKWIEQQNNE